MVIILGENSILAGRIMFKGTVSLKDILKIFFERIFFYSRVELNCNYIKKLVFRIVVHDSLLLFTFTWSGPLKARMKTFPVFWKRLVYLIINERRKNPKYFQKIKTKKIKKVEGKWKLHSSNALFLSTPNANKPNESSRAYVIQFWVVVTRQSLQRMTCKFEMEKKLLRSDVVCYCCCYVVLLLIYSI